MGAIKCAHSAPRNQRRDKFLNFFLKIFALTLQIKDFRAYINLVRYQTGLTPLNVSNFFQ